MTYWLAVVFGGAIGAALRALVYRWLPPADSGFPVATLAINLAGCFAIGLLWHILSDASAATRGFVFIGVLGALTTFSTFGLDTVRLMQHQEYGIAAAYVLASNLGGVALVGLGFKLGT